MQTEACLLRSTEAIESLQLKKLCVSELVPQAFRTGGSAGALSWCGGAWVLARFGGGRFRFTRLRDHQDLSGLELSRVRNVICRFEARDAHVIMVRQGGDGFSRGDDVCFSRRGGRSMGRGRLRRGVMSFRHGRHRGAGRSSSRSGRGLPPAGGVRPQGGVEFDDFFLESLIGVFKRIAHFWIAHRDLSDLLVLLRQITTAGGVSGGGQGSSREDEGRRGWGDKGREFEDHAAVSMTDSRREAPRKGIDSGLAGPRGSTESGFQDGVLQDQHRSIEIDDQSSDIDQGRK